MFQASHSNGGISGQLTHIKSSLATQSMLFTYIVVGANKFIYTLASQSCVPNWLPIIGLRSYVAHSLPIASTLADAHRAW